MGGSEMEVGHPNFQSLYGESNLRGFLVGCPAHGGEWPTPGEDGALTITGNVKGQAYRLTLSDTGSKNPGPMSDPGLMARLRYGSNNHVHRSTHIRATASMPSRRGVMALPPPMGHAPHAGR